MNTHELANFLSTDDGLAAFRSLQRLGVVGGAEATASSGAVAREGAQAILEWNPVAHGGAIAFERREFYRCKPKRIEAKRAETLRVCVFGESMAAGFPLAPAFTPAMVLEDLLKHALAPALGTSRDVEVIDLAVPNMGPTEQLRVAEAAAQLAPDVCVFMGGNNWYYGLSVEPTAPPDARAHYAAQLAEGGPQRLADAFRARLADRARVMTKAFVDAARAIGARAIVVIPPANHAWERSSPPTWLGAGRTATWFAHHDRARAALDAGDAQAAIAEAMAMEALDGGQSPTAPRLIAAACLAEDRFADARDAAMRAIDACNWHNYSWALPQTPSYVANAMRTAATDGAATCIDLERTFAEHTGSPYLDFRIFFDHCHLSVEGVRVGMAAIAAQICADLGVATAQEDLVSHAPQPLGVIAASGAFQAAHWASQFFPARNLADGRSVLDRQLRVAADDEALRSVLRDYVRLRSAACSPALNAALPKAARVPGVGATLRSTRLNAPFLAAILALLGERRDGEIDAIVAHLIETFDARLRDGLDLSHPSFREALWDRTPLAWNDPCERQASPFHRASWSESHFVLVCSSDRDITLDLTARSASAGDASVRVNDEPIGGLPLDKGWRRWRGVATAAQLRRGLNRVTVAWPTIAQDEDAALAVARRRFSLGADADLFPVTGEIFTLRAHTSVDA